MKRFPLLGILFIALAAHAMAYADLLTFSITQRVTGQVNGADFSAKLLTFSASITTEDLAACAAGGFCMNPFNGIDYYFLDYSATRQYLWTVEDVGRFPAELSGSSSLSFYYLNNSGRLEDIVITGGGDHEGDLRLPWPLVGDQCPEYLICPVTAYADTALITVSAIDGDPSFHVQLQPSGVIPEPSTLVLLGSGAAVLNATLPRRRRRVRS